jgi:uncharacterized protein (TIGR02145 family)
MKKITFSFTAILCLATLFIFSCGNDDPDPIVDTPNPNQFTDSRDGEVYKTVTIGTQTWMAENLNYNADGSKCYNDKVDSCSKFGKLYNSEQLTGIAPAGWHIPTDAEWKVLEKYYGMTDAEVEVYSLTGDDRGTRRDSLIAGTKFNALYSGYYYNNSFINNGINGSFWSSEGIYRAVSTSGKSIRRYDASGSTDRYISVRCIKN